MAAYCYPKVATTFSVRDNKEETIGVAYPAAVANFTCQAKTALGRGALSGCTLTDLKKRPHVVLLTTTNTGYIDMTMNMLESIRRTGLCLNTSIVVEDQKAYRYLLKRAQGDPAICLRKTTLGESSPTTSKVLSGPYRKLVNKRYFYILALLERGLDVFFSDVDTFWFRDPFSYFEGDFDMSFVDERSPYPYRLQTKSVHCAGLGYYKPTNKTLKFVRKWIEILQSKTNRRSDQGVLNYMLHKDIPMRVDISPLPLTHFPHGLIFYNTEWRKKNNDTIIQHNVGFPTHEIKVQKYKENNMWLVGNFMMDE